MRTVLYVYESQNNNGWKWCAVQTDERIGEVQRLAREKESLRINSKPAAVTIGVSATARLGIDLDRVEFCRPPEPKTDYRCRCLVVPQPVAPYPTEPGAPLTWQQAQARVDAGLGVETLRSERHPEEGWVVLGESPTNSCDKPSRWVDWTYRVPATAAESPALTIGKLTHELVAEKQAHATTKTELAAAQDQLLGLKSVVDFKNRKVGALIQDIQVTGQHLATVEIENRELRAKVAVLDKIKGML